MWMWLAPLIVLVLGFMAVLVGAHFERPLRLGTADAPEWASAVFLLGIALIIIGFWGCACVYVYRLFVLD